VLRVAQLKIIHGHTPIEPKLPKLKNHALDHLLPHAVLEINQYDSNINLITPAATAKINNKAIVVPHRRAAPPTKTHIRQRTTDKYWLKKKGKKPMQMTTKLGLRHSPRVSKQPALFPGLVPTPGKAKSSLKDKITSKALKIAIEAAGLTDKLSLEALVQVPLHEETGSKIYELVSIKSTIGM
jgi:hypothetical protein